MPTAEYRSFQSMTEALRYVDNHEEPLVVKASGEAAGKGVFVCKDQAEARRAVEIIMKDKAFGASGDTVVVEERLTGEEASMLALVDESSIYMLESAQDHKAAFDNDQGRRSLCARALRRTQMVRAILTPSLRHQSWGERTLVC